MLNTHFALLGSIKNFIWISEKGIDLLMQLEGLEGSNGQPSMTPYRDNVGVCTIGWGHVLPDADCRNSNSKTYPQEYYNTYGEAQFNIQKDVVAKYFGDDVLIAYKKHQAVFFGGSHPTAVGCINYPNP